MRLRRAGKRERALERSLPDPELNLKATAPPCWGPSGRMGDSGPEADMGQYTKREKRQINGDHGWLGAGSVTASAAAPPCMLHASCSCSLKPQAEGHPLPTYSLSSKSRWHPKAEGADRMRELCAPSGRSGSGRAGSHLRHWCYCCCCNKHQRLRVWRGCGGRQNQDLTCQMAGYYC